MPEAITREQTIADLSANFDRLIDDATVRDLVRQAIGLAFDSGRLAGKLEVMDLLEASRA